jgi:hypothetical protein
VPREMGRTRSSSPFTFNCLWLTLLDGGLRRSNPTRVGFDEAFVGWLAVRGACPQPAAALRTVSNAARVCRGVARRLREPTVESGGAAPPWMGVSVTPSANVWIDRGPHHLLRACRRSGAWGSA